jgi:large subunit ribosomal protein L9
MEVILKEDVANLGHRGDVVKVAEGYGRNFLLPRKLALQATLANKAVVEQMKSAAARRSASEKAVAEALVTKLEPVVLSFTRKTGEAGQLFGSVTSADIAAGLNRRGLKSIAARFSSTSLSRAWAISRWPSSCTVKLPPM